MNDILKIISDQFLAQIAALAAFFAFPAFQYVILKLYSRREGAPQLWYLPQYGFRLVIRNMPGKHTLTDLHYRTIIRKIIPPSASSGVKTYQDQILVEHEEFFLFPGNDQVLVSFRLEQASKGQFDFILTDKLGTETRRIPLSEFDRLICYYVANVKNLFNFNVMIAKQAELNTPSMLNLWKETRQQNNEGKFALDRIRDAG